MNLEDDRKKFDEFKQYLDLICKEANVKNFDFGLMTEDGKHIVYNQETRKFILTD